VLIDVAISHTGKNCRRLLGAANKLLVTRPPGSESNEVKVLKFAEKITSLQAKVLRFIFTPLPQKSK